MNTTLRIDAASEAQIANQAPTIASAIIKAEQTTTEAISRLEESSIRLAPTILEGFAGVLAVLYLLGACALAAALLFYTFSR
jgi:hypothetical protein